MSPHTKETGNNEFKDIHSVCLTANNTHIIINKMVKLKTNKEQTKNVKEHNRSILGDGDRRKLLINY